MASKHLMQIAVGGLFVVAMAALHSSPGSASARSAGVSDGEILSYECARSIATIVSPAEQTGPLFSVGHLIFTSLETQDGGKILLVNAGYGNFVINLEGNGVNRLRFEIPTSSGTPTRTFFLSYMHGGVLRSRYFEYSEEHPPRGRDELDYSLVSAHRADNLIPHLDYAIHETAEATLSAITEGKVTRTQILAHRVQNCEHIARQSPKVAKNLRHNLDILDLIVMGPVKAISNIASTDAAAAAAAASRGPASVIRK